MGLDIRHHLTSLVTEQRGAGLPPLRFSDFLEDEFRRSFCERHQIKSRPMLIAGSALIALASLGAIVTGHLSLTMAFFVFGILLPTLLATLFYSFRPGRHEVYQTLLALSAFWIAGVCSSLALRASLGGASYSFAAEVACIFVIWLALGLRFSHAACVAISISLCYLWGMLRWSVPQGELQFSWMMLLAVNMIGAYCAFQLETALRSAFLESRMLNELAERDGLTGLYNRRRYDENIQKVWRQSRRENSQFSLILIDIDHFKSYNDLYGHQAGDDALKQVADVIASCAKRPLDFAARFGGEEFALVLYGSAAEYGRELPEDLRRTVEELHIPHAESTTSPWLTVSIGLAIISPNTERSLAGAIQIADEALYQAKEEGRNRVVVKESRSAHIQTGRFRAARARASA